MADEDLLFTTSARAAALIRGKLSHVTLMTAVLSATRA